MTINANIYVLFILLLMIVAGVLAPATGLAQEPSSRACHRPSVLLCLALPFACWRCSFWRCGGHACRSGCQASLVPRSQY